MLNCPQKEYYDPITDACKNCFSGCFTCYGDLSTECDSCEAGKFFYGDNRSCHGKFDKEILGKIK